VTGRTRPTKNVSTSLATKHMRSLIIINCEPPYTLFSFQRQARLKPCTIHLSNLQLPPSSPQCIAHTQCASRARRPLLNCRTLHLHRRQPNPAAYSGRPTSVRTISVLFRSTSFLRHHALRLPRPLSTQRGQHPKGRCWALDVQRLRREHVVQPNYRIHFTSSTCE
jgi:hypothetical protein